MEQKVVYKLAGFGRFDKPLKGIVVKETNKVFQVKEYGYYDDRLSNYISHWRKEECYITAKEAGQGLIDIAALNVSRGYDKYNAAKKDLASAKEWYRNNVK